VRGSHRPRPPSHQPIQQLAFPDHAELLARRALLSGGIGFERVRQALQRVELALELRTARRSSASWLRSLSQSSMPYSPA